MSGGIAYILDRDESSRSRINTDMVFLEELSDSGEIDMVRSMIERHAEFTQSPVAADILSKWGELTPTCSSRSCRKISSGRWRNSPPKQR